MKTMMMAAGLLMAAATGAQAQSIVYNDFSTTDGLKLNGSAQKTSDGSRDVLRLTPTGIGQAGSAFSLLPRTLSADYGFSTRFTFNIANNYNGGADGLVFVIQTLSNNVGGAGGGIGYQGIANSLGVEFDTWNNGAGDGFSDNHIGIDLGGDLSSVVLDKNLPFQLDGGKDITSWVDYDGTTGKLDVRYAADGIRPILANLSYNVNLADVLGTTTAFVGFTSGTGAAASTHDIVSWEFRDSFSPIVTPAVPEPATWAMMILGFGVVGGALRRRSAATRPRLAVA